MAQNITIANATYSAVPAIDVPKQGGGTARYVDTAETAFVITVSWDSDEGMWLPDCTFAQVQTAYSAGRQIAIEVDPGEAIEDVQAAGVYDPTYYAYVVTSATYTGDKHTVYLLSNNGVAVDDEWAFYDAPTGNINITQSGVTDVTAYATATVAQGGVYADANSGFYTENGVYKWHFQPRADVEVGDSRGTPGYIPDFYYTSGVDHVFDALHPTTVTPSTSTQTIGGANTMMAGAVTVAAVPTGTEGTPTATKGAVSNHSVSVTPAVTNEAGMIVGGTHTGTPVTVSASELVSGSETKTANGTYDVTNLSEVVVDVPTPPSVEVEPLSVTDNGTYTAPSGKAYSPVTVNVSGGGGGSAEPNDVEYIDYDGTIVYSYSAADFAQLTAHPANPTHDGLVAQGWNWTLSDAQAYVAENGGLTIGQMYITESGDSEIDIVLHEGRLSPYLQFSPNGTVEIDWGDGSPKDTLTGTSLTTQKYKRHMYSAAGAYTITLHVVSGSFALFGTSPKPLLNDNASSANYNYVYGNSVKAVRIGSDASIGSYAFANCQSLASISMPSGLTIIKDHAFLNCYSLAFASIPNGVTSIGDYAFDYCYSLTSASMPGGVTSESTYTFRNCKSLRRVYIPNGVTSIGSTVFSGCSSLTSIGIADSVTKIGSSAFSTSYSFASISIPSGITSIGALAFNNCYGIGEFHVKASTPPTISSNTFSNIRSDCKFYVPAESLEAYKTASNWSSYASKMVGE